MCVCVCTRACVKGFLDKYISVTTWRPKQKILTLSPVVQDWTPKLLFGNMKSPPNLCKVSNFYFLFFILK